jgi:hypothetical protein
LHGKYFLSYFEYMSSPTAETESESLPITVRLEPELAEFIRQIAHATCNTTSGALRLCIRSAKDAALPMGIPFHQASAAQEMAKAS